MEAQAQSIEVGPVKVDTGKDWLDLAFAIILIAFLVFLTAKLKRR